MAGRVPVQAVHQVLGHAHLVRVALELEDEEPIGRFPQHALRILRQLLQREIVDRGALTDEEGQQLDVDAPGPSPEGLDGRLHQGRQPIVGLVQGEAVLLPEGEVEHGLHLLGRAVHQHLHGLGKAQLVDDVEELVGRQGADGRCRIGRGKERVRAPRSLPMLQPLAVARKGDDVGRIGLRGLPGLPGLMGHGHTMD